MREMLLAIAIAALVSGIGAWKIQSWRAAADKADELKVTVEAQQKDIKDLADAVKKNNEIAAKFLAKEKEISEKARIKTGEINQRTQDVQTMAKSLAPTGYKLDAAHQQLLQQITEIANSGSTRQAAPPTRDAK